MTEEDLIRSIPVLLEKPFLETGDKLNNGNDRAGWLQLTPGVGQSPKRPGQWMDLVLLP